MGKNTPPTQNSKANSPSEAEMAFRKQVKIYYQKFGKNPNFDENVPSKEEILKDAILIMSEVLTYRKNAGLASYYKGYEKKGKGLMHNLFIRDEEAQTDIYHDTWVKIFKSLDKGNSCPYEYEPYFMSILRFTCVDYIKANNWDTWIKLAEEVMNEIPQSIGNEEEINAFYSMLLEAIETLEEPIQSAWKLHYYWLLNCAEVERNLRKVKFGKLAEVLDNLQQIEGGFNHSLTQMKLPLSYTQDKDSVKAMFWDGLKTNIKKLQAFLGLEKEPRKNEIASLMTKARIKLDTYFYQDKEKGYVLVSDKDNTPVFLDTNGNILEALSDDNKRVFEHIVLDKAGKLVEIPAQQTIRNSMGRNGAWTQRLIEVCKKVIFGNRNL